METADGQGVPNHLACVLRGAETPDGHAAAGGRCRGGQSPARSRCDIPAGGGGRAGVWAGPRRWAMSSVTDADSQQ